MAHLPQALGTPLPSLASNSLQMDAPQLAIQAEVDKRPILQPGDVGNERPAVPDRTHRVLIFSCKQAGNNRISWVPCLQSKTNTECRSTCRHDHFHRGIPLLSHPQPLGVWVTINPTLTSVFVTMLITTWIGSGLCPCFLIEILAV